MEFIGSVFEALQVGLPILLFHFAVTLALFCGGVFIYQHITPYHEFDLVDRGNTAAGIAVAGLMIGLAIPLAATLASNVTVANILLWGVVAVVFQLLTFVVASRLIKGIRLGIENGNVAYGMVLLGIQIAVGMINAGAMLG